MRFRFTIFILLIISEFTFAQLVTSDPPYPTENDSVVIYYDASLGNQGLKGFTGDVYAHTGVITNSSIDSHDWKHVITTWGQNTSDTKLIRDSLDHYHFVVGYPRQYYNRNQSLSSTETILKLAFVFRSATASNNGNYYEGKDVGNTDIIYNLYTAGSYSLVLEKPSVTNQYNDPLRSPLFVSQNDTVNIIAKAAAIGTSSSSITLFVNGIQKSQVSGDSLNYNFIASTIGSTLITIVGKDSTTLTDTLKFAVMVNPAIVDAKLPPGNELGINYKNDPTQITLALFAPYKKFVYLIGDFDNTDWKVNLNYLMKRDSVSADSVIWWTDLTVSPGNEYAFQYFVDGEIRIADPYSTKILDPSNDSNIPNNIYPNLKSYPAGKTSYIVSTFQTGNINYTWQVNNFVKPEKDRLVIYELLVRDFVSTHWFKTIEDTLNYLKTLGTNAIEFMPVMEFEGNNSWGYNTDFQMALDKYYGTETDFKSLIDKAHSMGIAVILDIVFNHTFGQSPLARLYWDSQNNRPAANNPWLNVVPKHDYNVGNDFNHESPQTKYFVDKVSAYWIQNYHIDGFRFDLSKGFTQKNTLGDVSAWGNYDQSRVNILERIANKIWSVDSTSILILEHFADNNEEDTLSTFGFLLWGKMTDNYNQATMGYTNGSDLRWAYYKNRNWTKSGLVTFMESHDEERLMFKNEQYGNSLGSYNIKNLEVGLNRMKEASAFFFLIPGPKMIWQFGELGYDYSINYPSGNSSDRLTAKPIKWDYFSVPGRLNLYKAMKAVIYLKQNYPTFSTTATMDVGSSIKRITFSDTTMRVNIIGNFGVASTTIDANFAETGLWYDYFSGSSNYIGNQHQQVALEPGEFHIYTTMKLPTPEAGLTDINSKKKIIIDSYKLEQNYPNPFNPSTVISYQIPEPALVSVKIYDLLGREIKTLVNDFRKSGIYSVSFNAANLASGIYFYQIKAGNFISTKKMILMK